MTVHCWKDYREWVEETYGCDSDERAVVEFLGVGATCMLHDGHPGPHEWTPDSNIEVTFAAISEDGKK